MIDVKIFKKSKQSGSGSSGSASTGYAGSTGSGKTGLADRAKRADYADEAGYAAYAGDLVATSPAFDRWLRKDRKDTAQDVITFDKGLEAGEWAEGTSGAALWMDDDGLWHFESDFVNIRKKLTATEVAIQDVHHVGGQMLLTAASCKADFVVDKGSYYRVFFLRHDSDGNTVKNLWRVGDQAYCQTFNLTEETTDNFSNTFYWRLVTGVSTASTLDTGTYEVDGQEVSGSDYHYVDLSKTVAASASDAPSAGDDIVQLGYRGTDDAGRQTAILIAGASADGSSPFIRLFEGIDNFSLPSDVEQLKPGDNRLKGVLKMMEGSTLEDGRDVNHLGTSRGNLLKNTGFTGDFESVEVSEEGQTITDAMPIYSDRLKYWDATNVEVLADTDSASGYSAKLGVLSQTVEGGWKEGEWYMLSLRAAQGTLTIEAGGEAKAATLTDWERIDFPFQASTTDGVVRFSGTAKVCEIMLTAGNLPTEWHKASTDNDKSMAEYFGLDYLRKAITDATTNIIGGLVMTQILKVGNYRNGEMSEETGGMSGAYNDDKSPFLWGGGTMEDAIYTITKYAKNPAYQPTEEEVSRMAKFVVTHGGRAILNDIVLRGYIYALGGVFNGTVYAHDGEFSGEDGMYKLSLNAANRTISIYGPSLVDENGQPIEGAEQVLYAIIGGWSKRPSRKGFITAPNISMRALNASQETIQILGMDALNGFSILDANGNKLSGLSESIMGGSGINHFYLGNIPTSADSAATGEVYNDNGTLKIKQ